MKKLISILSVLIFASLILIHCDFGDSSSDPSDSPAPGFTRYYPDRDGDNYGDESDFMDLQSPEGEYTLTNGSDCNESNASINPGASEVCNGSDNNCDGAIDTGGCGDHSSCVNGGGSYSCVCTGTFRNCDGNQSNGCEVDTSSDDDNCGGCRILCSPGQSCVDSDCITL